ncbi:MAG: hypothetical protein K8R90_09435 [Candidatus Cloacimonetes bacterium]|nr:hypothetical protein [Candidatus Cloacimonadota bacterium]
MARFSSALQRTLRWEGGYAHDPADPGGETWQGVSRRAHPDWEGWPRVDACKRQPGFPGNLANAGLTPLVRLFYRENYWLPLLAERWASQPLAQAVFDAAVHGGLRTAIRRLQRCLNLLLPTSALHIDGVVGQHTLKAIEQALARDRGEDLLHAYLSLRLASLLQLAERRPASKRFVRGWLRRCVGFLPSEHNKLDTS